MLNKLLEIKKQVLTALLLIISVTGCGQVLDAPATGPGSGNCQGDACLIDEEESYPKPENLVVAVSDNDKILTWAWTESDPYAKIQEVIIQRSIESDSNTSFVNIAVVDNDATTYTDATQVAGSLAYRVLVNYRSPILSTESNITNGVTTQTQFTKIANGENFTCGMTISGSVKCWGNNEFGQLGNASTTDSSVPVTVQDASGVSDISAGPMHVCVVASGSVKCWGSNEDNQIGDFVSNYYASVPVTIPGISGATSVSTGSFHACARTSTGAVKCWGANFYGQLGNGNNIDNPSPGVTTPIASGATAVAAGGRHSCAIVSGSIKCWGKNNTGQLGLGNYVDNFSPTSLASTYGSTSITAGDTHTCAIIVGTVKCWGQDNYGQLGDGSIVAPSHVSLSPTALTLTYVVSIFAGDRNTCAVLGTEDVRCWGYTFPQTPGLISSIAGASFVSPGTNHTCALVNNFAKCWGENYYGQLGDGTTNNSTTPVDIF